MKKHLLIILVIGLAWTNLAQAATTKPKIALTFDADMTASMLAKLNKGLEKSLYNQNIIQLLRQTKTPATIFITGLWAKKYPAAVKDIASDTLFEIGSHSYNHEGFTADCYGLGTLNQKDKALDLAMSKTILGQLTGHYPTLFRFPGGCSAPDDVKLVNQAGMTVVGWDFASGDAFNTNTPAIIWNVLQKAKNGSIIVFHLSGGHYAPETAKALKTIIPALKKRGFEFVKVSELLP